MDSLFHVLCFYDIFKYLFFKYSITKKILYLKYFVCNVCTFNVGSKVLNNELQDLEVEHYSWPALFILSFTITIPRRRWVLRIWQIEWEELSCRLWRLSEWEELCICQKLKSTNPTFWNDEIDVELLLKGKKQGKKFDSNRELLT